MINKSVLQNGKQSVVWITFTGIHTSTLFLGGLEVAFLSETRTFPSDCSFWTRVNARTYPATDRVAFLQSFHGALHAAFVTSQWLNERPSPCERVELPNETHLNFSQYKAIFIGIASVSLLFLPWTPLHSPVHCDSPVLCSVQCDAEMILTGLASSHLPSIQALRSTSPAF